MSNLFMLNATQFVNQEMVFPNTQVLSHKEYISDGKRYIDVTLIGEALPKDSLQLAMLHKLDSVGLGGTILNIKQGFSLNGFADNSKSMSQLYGVMQQEIMERQNRIDSLQAIITRRNDFADESTRLAPEVKVLFPEIEDIALSNMVLSGVDNSLTDTVNMVFIRSSINLSEQQRDKIADYIAVRLHRTNVHVSVNPHSFPWPSVTE